MLCCFAAFLLAGKPYAEKPRRIVSGMPSITEMLFALGLEERIVGVTTNCNYPPQAQEKEKVGGFFLNLEKVVSLNPDLVVMLENAQKREVKKFRDYGLPVYTINPNSIVEVMASLVELGEVTGQKEKAERLLDEMEGRILSVEARVKNLQRKKVLVVVGYDPLIVVGGGNFIDDVIKHAGAKNIAGKAKSAYPQYSFEKLLEENPDYMIIPAGVVSWEEIQKNSRWRALNAVKYDRILFVDEDILSRPGPRVVEAIEKIAEFIHEKKT